jgi:hypothetical protein
MSKANKTTKFNVINANTVCSTGFASHGKEWLRINKDGELKLFDIDAMNEQAELGNLYAMAYRAVYEAGKKEQGMGDLIEQLRKRILILNEQGIMPDLVRELEGSILKVEQLQARCTELERERIEVARKAFVAGADWQERNPEWVLEQCKQAAKQYAQREYGVHPKQ